MLPRSLQPKPIPSSVWLNAVARTTNSSSRSHVPISIQSLNSQLKHSTRAGFFHKSLRLYRALRSSDTKPDTFTLPSVLKACAALHAIDEGASIHSHIVKAGFAGNPFTMNSLIEMYSRFNSLRAARRVFDEMPQRNPVSWNLMISGYRAGGHQAAALELCASMKHEGMALDEVGLKIILPICGLSRASRLGESIHAHVITLGVYADTALATAVLDMYAKCGGMDAAERLFDEISLKDVISWNAMITGYTQIGKPELVLQLFHDMVGRGFEPSIPTILLALQASTHRSVLRAGMSIHGFVTKLGFGSDLSIKGLLIDMYSKCGELISACVAFTEISEGNVNSWSCMIHGLGMHGRGEEALMGFFRMLKSGVEPDAICFINMLSSFSHCGMIDEGRKMFYYMVEHFGIEPGMEHYASLVDLLGRAGCIDEALGFMSEMTMEPGSSVVGAFLGGCRIHGRLEMGERLAGSGSSVAGFYKLLVGIHAGQGRWDEVREIRRVMEEKGVRGVSGCSSIELNS